MCRRSVNDIIGRSEKFRSAEEALKKIGVD